MNMEFVNLLASMDKETAEKHSKKYLDLMLKHGWKRGGDRIVRQEYSKWAMEEQAIHKISSSHPKQVFTTKPNIPDFSTLDAEFQGILVEDLTAFRNCHTEFSNIITLSDTTRTQDNQVDKLIIAWRDNTLGKTYPNPLHSAMQKAAGINYTKYTKEELRLPPFSLSERVAIAAEEFFKNPTSETAKKVFISTASSMHMKGVAIDISGTAFGHNHKMKRSLVEFLNKTGRYKMFLYRYNKDDGSYAAYTAENNTFRTYRSGNGYNLQEIEHMWQTLSNENSPQSTNSRWFIHVEKK